MFYLLLIDYELNLEKYSLLDVPFYGLLAMGRN